MLLAAVPAALALLAADAIRIGRAGRLRAARDARRTVRRPAAAAVDDAGAA
jgi:hypothetical protein